MKISLKTVSIRHIQSVVPEKIVNNSDLNFDEDLKTKIIKSTGVEKRHVLHSNQTLVELYIAAAQQTLEKLDWSVESINGIIVVSQTHEYKLPSTACVLHGLLNLSQDAFGFDIGMGCSGYLYGLYSGASTISLANGAIERVLVFVGDAIGTLCYSRNKSTTFLFGDAATCTALEYDSQAVTIPFLFKTDGKGYSHIIVEHGGLKHPIDESSYVEYEDTEGNINIKSCLSMNGAEVFNFTLMNIPDLIEETIEFAGIKKERVDAYCFHQANKFMIDFLSTKSKVTEKTPINLDAFGNTSCASIPLLICDKPDRCLKPYVMLIGFGVGFSMGTAIVDLTQTSTGLMLAV